MTPPDSSPCAFFSSRQLIESIVSIKHTVGNCLVNTAVVSSELLLVLLALTRRFISGRQPRAEARLLRIYIQASR